MVLGMNPPPVPPKFGTFEYAAIPVLPSSPTPSSPRTASFHSTHLRRRSSFGIDNDVTIHLGGGTSTPSSAEKRRYDKISSEKPSGENEPLNAIGGGAGKGYLAWKDARVTSRRAGVKRCIAVLALLLVCVLGWLGGLATSEASTIQQRHSTCNPYDQHGVLHVNTSQPSDNYWQPLSASPDCQPVDYMSLLYTAATRGTISPQIKFAQGRTVVLLGDSVDRDHNEHLCQFMSGWHEMIGSDHPLSPPYPSGQEVPPENYTNWMTGKREWPNWLQSRPWVCHVPKLNFRIVNVFHYGFQEADYDNGYIMTHPHFYPPASVEERFDQIVVPLMEGLATKYNVSAVPDIVSITAGFWSQLRQSVADQTASKLALEQGMAIEEAKTRFDPWRPMEQVEKKWFEGRIYETLRHCAREWKGVKDARGRIKRPDLLWRALHPIKETNTVPFTRTVAVDEIGRSVVENLVDESRAALEGASTWKSWTRQLGAKALGWTRESKTEAINEDLAHRLRVDDWGAHMIGQTRYFRDEVHPLALPGSWLYGNMLLHQLRVTADDEKRR
ncbi:hypothetical protein JCM11491_004975 [Sporobolomyces phaffii]